MSDSEQVKIAVVDYGLGNLFSVKHACEHAGMEAVVTSTSEEILNSDAVILPGVGAFGDAMESLRRLNLVSPLKEIALSQKPLVGICLGMQLLMKESYEFGRHRGLGIIKGSVVRFEDTADKFGKLKVPHLCWNRIFKNNEWSGSTLDGLSDGEFMYFVHSFYVKLEDPGLALSKSQYGKTEFCSSLRCGNNFAFQFHPERSGPQGLRIYRNLSTIIQKQKSKEVGQNA